jgi:hypothetical protein
LVVTDVGEAHDPSHVEFRGVAAGPFDPAIWEKGPPHLVPDARSPLLAPRDDAGKFRNIYAPSVIARGDGWRIFFGGWDGAESGNDRIYSVDADAHFATFTNRRTVIGHGLFQHVCNVSVAKTPDGFAMACTAYPDARGLNKPVTFFSADAETWSATTAAPEHFISMTGYEPFAAADINGMNVLLHDAVKGGGGALRLYFNNFRDPAKTFRASSTDGRRFTFDRVVAQPSAFVNDVKKLTRHDDGGPAYYLAAFHQNTDRLFFSLSRDPLKFPEQQTLLTCRGDADRHIVSAGFVATDDRVLGVLYGAGAAPTLDRNRIFARWFQKKVFVDGIEPEAAAGPDRQLLRLPAERRAATIKLLADDGVTLIATSPPTVLSPGRAYQLSLPARPAAKTPPSPTAPARAATDR